MCAVNLCGTCMCTVNLCGSLHVCVQLTYVVHVCVGLQFISVLHIYMCTVKGPFPSTLNLKV